MKMFCHRAGNATGKQENNERDIRHKIRKRLG
jgi:hypothetical protein